MSTRRLSIRVAGVTAAIAALLGLSATSALAWNPDCKEHGSGHSEWSPPKHEEWSPPKHEEWSPPKHEEWTPPVQPAPKPAAPAPAPAPAAPAPAPAPVPAPAPAPEAPAPAPASPTPAPVPVAPKPVAPPAETPAPPVVELGIPVAPTPETVPETPEVHEKKGVLGKVGTRKETVKGKVGTRGQPTTTPVALVQAGSLPHTGFGGSLSLALLGMAALTGGYLLLRRTQTA